LLLTILALPPVHGQGGLPLSKFAPYSLSLSADDLKHGEQQIEQMIHDRPEMASYVQNGDPVWTWTSRQFAGEFIGSRIDWVNYPSQYFAGRAVARDYTSFYIRPQNGRNGYITVSAARIGSNRSGELMWARLIFELFNIRSAAASLEVQRQAARGKLSKDEFIRQITTLEYTALKESVSFYKTVWQVDCQKKGIETHDVLWNSPVPASYKEWIDQFTDLFSYPWNVYGDMYDRLQVRGVSGDESRIILPAYR
jgi:hypothetical protein